MSWDLTPVSLSIKKEKKKIYALITRQYAKPGGWQTLA